VNARSVAHASSQKHGFYAYLRHEHHHEHAASDSDSRTDVAIVDHAQHHLMRVMCIFCLSVRVLRMSMLEILRAWNLMLNESQARIVLHVTNIILFY
jgi:hypothetical protein